MRRIHLQPGLGDAIHALPYVIELGKKERFEMFTRYPEVFERVNGIELSVAPLARRPGDVVFQWTRAGFKTFAEKYAIDSGVKVTDYSEAQKLLAFETPERIGGYAAGIKRMGKKLCVFGPPRAAERHKKTHDFSCAASFTEAFCWTHLNRDKFYYVKTGKAEIYQVRCKIPGDLDLTDKLTLKEFITLIRISDAVASQESCFTVLACLFNKPMKIFKAMSQTEEQHKEHVRRTTFNNPVFIE